MNVFDFDNTIYRGESPVDFAFFLLRTHKQVYLYLPSIFYNSVKYKLCLVSREKMEEIFNHYLKTFPLSTEELNELIAQFWKEHEHKLDPEMLRRIKPDDIILSAGPSILIQGIRHKLNTEHVIATEIDFDAKRVLYYNFRENKVKRFHELFGEQRIHKFYTDSYNDRALMDISDRVFLMRKKKMRRIK